jgi:hypothetical protein
VKGAVVALFCNCRRVVSRGEEYRVVKGRRWDCPSCGLDRKRTLAQMCDTAGVQRMVTLTFDQPRVVYVGAPSPGLLPGRMGATISDGKLAPPPEHLEVLDVTAIPARHVRCDAATHIYWNLRHGGFRWRLLPSCVYCCSYVSACLRKWAKRMRRLWPDFQYLHVREVHKSGAMHLHVAVTGVPRVVTRRSAAGGKVRDHWRQAGGGFVDVGRHGEHAGGGAGWYVGKYLAKRQDDGGFARGYRRWSRSGEFAPLVRMVPKRDPDYDGGWADDGSPLRLGGWVHPDGAEHRGRWWHETADLNAAAVGWHDAAQRRLDARTANWPQSLARVLPPAVWKALRDAAGPSPVLPVVVEQLTAF